MVSDRTTIPYRADKAKVLPTCLYPMNRNGRFRTNRKIPSGSLVTFAIIREIPVIPPSIIAFGTRNSSSDTPARIAPAVIKRNFNSNSVGVSFLGLCTITNPFFKQISLILIFFNHLVNASSLQVVIRSTHQVQKDRSKGRKPVKHDTYTF